MMVMQLIGKVPMLWIHIVYRTFTLDDKNLYPAFSNTARILNISGGGVFLGHFLYKESVTISVYAKNSEDQKNDEKVVQCFYWC